MAYMRQTLGCMVDEPAPVSTWRLGDGVQRASRVAALGFAALAAAFILAGQPLPGMFVLVAGVGLQLSLGRLWHHLPRAIGRPMVEALSAWTSFAMWQTGILLVAASWSGPHEVGMWGAACLLTASFLQIHVFGGAIYRARRALPVRNFLAGLIPAAILTGVAAVLLALSFQPEAAPALRHVALSLFVFGSLFPAGMTSMVFPRRGEATHA